MDVDQTPKKSKFPILIFFGLITLAGIIVLLVYSEREQKEMKEMQGTYHAKIQTIKMHLNEGNCTQAAFEYANAKEMREDIVKRGLYYSIEPHSKQAHAIEIAECFANRKEYKNAVGILTIKENNDPDYLMRASVIYSKSGDMLKAAEAKEKAEQYER